MVFQRLKGCCGATELHRISIDPINVRSDLRKIATGVLGRNANTAGGYHLVIATLSINQTLERNALEKCGFSEAHSWINGITGRELFLMTKEIRIKEQDAH